MSLRRSESDRGSVRFLLHPVYIAYASLFVSASERSSEMGHILPWLGELGPHLRISSLSF